MIVERYAHKIHVALNGLCPARKMLASGALTDPDEITFILAQDSRRQKLIKDATYKKKFDYT